MRSSRCLRDALHTMSMKRLKSQAAVQAGVPVCVQGWVRTVRKQKHVSFLHLNDGTTQHGVQVTMSPDIMAEFRGGKLTTGASVSVNGALIRKPAAEDADAERPFHEVYELEASKVRLLATQAYRSHDLISPSSPVTSHLRTPAL